MEGSFVVDDPAGAGGIDEGAVDADGDELAVDGAGEGEFVFGIGVGEEDPAATLVREGVVDGSTDVLHGCVEVRGGDALALEEASDHVDVCSIKGGREVLSVGKALEHCVHDDADLTGEGSGFGVGVFRVGLVVERVVGICVPGYDDDGCWGPCRLPVEGQAMEDLCVL